LHRTWLLLTQSGHTAAQDEHPPFCLDLGQTAFEFVGPKYPKQQRSTKSGAGMAMMRERSEIILVFLSAALATPTLAQTRDILGDNYSIMVPEKGSKRQVSKREQPEPWLAPKYKSPRGTVKQARIPKSRIVNPPSGSIPSSVYVPQTGRTFQNLPSVPGAGPGGAETFQDRAVRCTHQAGVYGQSGAGRGAYMGSCL
jgi:hypothetical protein